MKIELLPIFLVLLLTTSVSAELYYNISLNYDKGVMKINSVNTIYSQYDLNKNEGDFVVGLKENNEDFYFFQVPNVIASDYTNSEGNLIDGSIDEIDYLDFNIYVPYKKVSEINIYDSTKTLLDKKDFVEQDIEIKEDNKERKTIIEKDYSLLNYFLIGFVFILILVLVIWYYSFREKK